MITVCTSSLPVTYTVFKDKLYLQWMRNYTVCINSRQFVFKRGTMLSNSLVVGFMLLVAHEIQQGVFTTLREILIFASNLYVIYFIASFIDFSCCGQPLIYFAIFSE